MEKVYVHIFFFLMHILNIHTLATETHYQTESHGNNVVIFYFLFLNYLNQIGTRLIGSN
jgi:hypothetical protein